MNKLLLIFIILSILNVIIQTIKSLVTINCGKTLASIVNAFAYGLYTIVIVYTNADFPLWEKVIVTAFVNLVGVYLVKLAEEKMRKDKLWKVEFTIRNFVADEFEIQLNNLNLSSTRIKSNGKYSIFYVYCETQKETELAHLLADKYNAKYFISESKSF